MYGFLHKGGIIFFQLKNRKIKQEGGYEITGKKKSNLIKKYLLHLLHLYIKTYHGTYAINLPLS